MQKVMFKDTVEVEIYHPIKVSSMERRQWITLRTIWPFSIIFQQQFWVETLVNSCSLFLFPFQSSSSLSFKSTWPRFM